MTQKIDTTQRAKTKKKDMGTPLSTYYCVRASLHSNNVLTNPHSMRPNDSIPHFAYTLSLDHTYSIHTVSRDVPCCFITGCNTLVLIDSYLHHFETH